MKVFLKNFGLGRLYNMPELPEVEITKIGLWAELSHQPELTKIIYHRKDLRWDLPLAAKKIVPQQKLVQLRRRGKYLIFEFTKSVLISHLGMSGSWRKAAEEETLKKHDHIEFIFSDDLRFIFNDPRRFGFLELIKDKADEPEYFKNMGFEPLDKSWTTEGLWEKLRRQNRSVKVAIMDQKNIVGVGNIYACEALFSAGISPFLNVSKIKLNTLVELRSAIVLILSKSIQRGGSSIQNFAHTSGQKGSYQKSFLVYDQAGMPCFKCETPIRFKNLAGRATYWCPKCQKQ